MLPPAALKQWNPQTISDSPDKQSACRQETTLFRNHKGSTAAHPRKLGRYEILSPLGAGGMGEVYKALDTRLDRSVAVKVLPGHIAQREELRTRFEREARAVAVASLNHPNICTLFDIGSQDGTGI